MTTPLAQAQRDVEAAESALHAALGRLEALKADGLRAPFGLPFTLDPDTDVLHCQVCSWFELQLLHGKERHTCWITSTNLSPFRGDVDSALIELRDALCAATGTVAKGEG